MHTLRALPSVSRTCCRRHRHTGKSGQEGGWGTDEQTHGWTDRRREGGRDGGRTRQMDRQREGGERRDGGWTDRWTEGRREKG